MDSMKSLRISLIILLITITTSCVHSVKPIETDTDVQLEVDYGYLLIGVETNLDLKSLSIFGAKNIKLTRANLRKGTNYFLLEMPVGQYNIEKIELNSWLKTILEGEHYGFEVKSGAINYVGHFKITSFGAWPAVFSKHELANRSSEALVFMEQNFPNIFGSRKLLYQGPGDDVFLNRFSHISATKKGDEL
jgi:hypothetical protein